MKSNSISQSITNIEAESLKIYFKEISKIPLLTKEEEYELAKKAKKGNQRAKDKLITSNLRFVISIAKQYQNQGLGLEDLISEGTIGLIKSVNKYNPDKGFRFISYAVWWIKQSIIKAINEQNQIIRVPWVKTAASSKINKCIAQFEQFNGISPSDDEIAELCNMSIDKVNQILTAYSPCVSLDKTIGSEEESTLNDIIADPDSIISDYDMDYENRQKYLNKLLSHLNDREYAVALMYWGLKGIKPMNLRAIGKRFGLTGERIYQIRNNIIKKFKTFYIDDAKKLL